jgi:hypothetical protein
LNPSYAEIDTNRVRLTLTSNGKIGYNNYYPLQGFGMDYNRGGSLLYEGGLAIAQNTQKVSRAFMFQYSYKIFKGVHPVIPALVCDERWESECSDSTAGFSSLGLSIKLDAMEWNSVERSDFVILNYTLKNNSSTDLTNIYSGIYLDWDIANSIRNKTLFNPEIRLSYSWYTGQTNLYSGVKLLSPITGYHYAFDVTTTGNGGINISDGLSNAELYEALTTNRNEAGVSANGNEIATLISYGPLQIASHDSVVLSYALLASNSLYNLEAGAAEAQTIYDSLYIYTPINNLQVNSINVFPNPASHDVSVYVNSVQEMTSEIDIFNPLGENIHSMPVRIHNGKNVFRMFNRFSSGLFIVKIRLSDGVHTKKLIVK